MLSSRDVVRYLFNEASTSDLTLVVHGRHYYGHKSILGRCSELVAGMLRSNLIDHSDSKAVIRIDPPATHLPTFADCDCNEQDLVHDSVFDAFLLITYGLKNPAALSVKELCRVAVLSNFMLSAKLSHVCEKLIVQKFCLSEDSWQDAFQFANRHGFALLTRCILDYAATLVHRSDCIEELLRLMPSDIYQILRLMRLSAREQFRLVICYLAHQSDQSSTAVMEHFDSIWSANNTPAAPICISGDERIDFLKQSATMLAPSWNDRDLLCKIKLIADNVVMTTTSGEVVSDNFLYSAILNRLIILMRQSAEASNTQSGISTRFHKESHRNTIS